MKLTEMTESQNALFEKHYDILKNYARRLHGDAYYDAAVDGFLAAVQRYDRHPGLQAVIPFEIIARRMMKDEVCRVSRKEAKDRGEVVIISLDSMRNQRRSVHEYVAAPGDIEEDLEAKLALADVLTRLTRPERDTIMLIHAGYTSAEVGSMFGIKVNSVYGRVYQMRHRIRQDNDE